MAPPGIKGSVFAGIVEHLRTLRDSGRIDADQLELRLGREGAALVDAKIVATAWYPIELYGRIRELLCDVEGGGRDEYTLEAAAASARRLKEGGLYQQLDYLDRWRAYVPTGDAERDAEQRRSLFRSQLSMVATIYSGLFNFGSTKITDDPDHRDRLQIEYWDEGVMPRIGRVAVLGFWNEIGKSWLRRPDAPCWRQVDAGDHFALRLTRDIADL